MPCTIYSREANQMLVQVSNPWQSGSGPRPQGYAGGGTGNHASARTFLERLPPQSQKPRAARGGESRRAGSCERQNAADRQAAVRQAVLQQTQVQVPMLLLDKTEFGNYTAIKQQLRHFLDEVYMLRQHPFYLGLAHSSRV